MISLGNFTLIYGILRVFGGQFFLVLIFAFSACLARTMSWCCQSKTGSIFVLQYVEAVQELVEAEEQICSCMLQRLEEMNVKAKVMFRRATE